MSGPNPTRARAASSSGQRRTTAGSTGDAAAGAASASTTSTAPTSTQPSRSATHTRASSAASTTTTASAPASGSMSSAAQTPPLTMAAVAARAAGIPAPHSGPSFISSAMAGTGNPSSASSQSQNKPRRQSSANASSHQHPVLASGPKARKSSGSVSSQGHGTSTDVGTYSNGAGAIGSSSSVGGKPRRSSSSISSSYDFSAGGRRTVSAGSKSTTTSTSAEVSTSNPASDTNYSGTTAARPPLGTSISSATVSQRSSPKDKPLDGGTTSAMTSTASSDAQHEGSASNRPEPARTSAMPPDAGSKAQAGDDGDDQLPNGAPSTAEERLATSAVETTTSVKHTSLVPPSQGDTAGSSTGSTINSARSGTKGRRISPSVVGPSTSAANTASTGAAVAGDTSTSSGRTGPGTSHGPPESSAILPNGKGAETSNSFSTGANFGPESHQSKASENASSSASLAQMRLAAVAPSSSSDSSSRALGAASQSEERAPALESHQGSSEQIPKGPDSSRTEAGSANVVEEDAISASASNSFSSQPQDQSSSTQQQGRGGIDTVTSSGTAPTNTPAAGAAPTSASFAGSTSIPQLSSSANAVPLPSGSTTSGAGVASTLPVGSVGGSSLPAYHYHQPHHPHHHHSQHHHHHFGGGGTATTPLMGGSGSSAAYERLTTELTSNIIAFLTPILPTEEEYRIKEATRRQLERLACRVSPGAKLLAFGSMANGFALRNSDMDLCCLLNKKEGEAEERSASVLVEILGQLIREETDFNVMMLPKARIPIIKISRVPSPDLPYEISCDIGFENRLALENTRLLLSYAMVDPPRLRTLVLFLKVWTKRRKLNSPYTGTLSSYGYTLLVLFFLCHVKRPPILPNLQRIPPSRPLNPEEVELNGHNIYFYDDIATLRQQWVSQNTENVGELLIDFFRYFSKEFSYARDVISLRTEGGLMSKDKDWTAELCIEDPFQLGYNVSRTVTKDGLYTIRGEFMRATRILLGGKHQRMSSLIAELCEEREDIITRAPDTPVKRHPSLGPNSRNTSGSHGHVPAVGGSAAGVAGTGTGLPPLSLGGTGGLGLGVAYHHATAGTLAVAQGGLASPPTASAAAAAAAAVAAAAAGGHAAGLIDPRLMREYREFYDSPRRYDSSYASGLGGSFAFEEMARGLGLGQQGYRSVPAYPPTTAMLRPLSQNNGLAQRLGSGGPGSSNVRGASVSATSSRIGSSSVGMGSGSDAATQAGSKSSTSPGQAGSSSASNGASMAATVSESGHGASISDTAKSGSSTGAAVGIGIGGVPGTQVDAYGYPVDMGFTDALSRSKSLPRPFIDDHRGATPLRSEPASPKLGPSTAPRAPARDYGQSATFHALQPAMAAMSVSGPVPPSLQSGQSPSMPSSNVAVPTAGAPLSSGASSGGPASPNFGDAVDPNAPVSTPMSVSASAGPARYMGGGVPMSGGPPGSSMAWSYAPGSSAALAAAYAQAAAAAAVAAAYPTSAAGAAAAAAYSYATASAAGGVPGAPAPSYAIQASPMQYAQGFMYDGHGMQPGHGPTSGSEQMVDPRAMGTLPEGGTGGAGTEDVFGVMGGTPLMPAMGYGAGGAFVPGMAIPPLYGMSGPVEHGYAGGSHLPNGDEVGDGAEQDDDVDGRSSRRGRKESNNDSNGGDDGEGANSDLSEGTLDELARLSALEAKDEDAASSPGLGPSRSAHATSGGARPQTTSPPARTTVRSEKDVQAPTASPAIDIASSSQRTSASRAGSHHPNAT